MYAMHPMHPMQHKPESPNWIVGWEGGGGVKPMGMGALENAVGGGEV